MARVLDPVRDRPQPEARRRQQQSLTSRQRERMRRATRIWERQRSVFMRLLIESMEEFGITQAELSQERRKLAGRMAGDAAVPSGARRTEAVAAAGELRASRAVRATTSRQATTP